MRTLPWRAFTAPSSDRVARVVFRARLVAVACVVLLANAVVACDEEPQGPGGPALDCSDEVTEVTAEISTGDDVVFDWSPRCRVALLGVEGEDGDRWWIGLEDENTIEPPVAYGVTPAGLPEEDALPLIEGETYELILWIVAPEGAYLAAVQEFVR